MQPFCTFYTLTQKNYINKHGFIYEYFSMQLSYTFIYFDPKITTKLCEYGFIPKVKKKKKKKN